MKTAKILATFRFIAGSAVLAAVLVGAAGDARAGDLRVVATVPDLGALSEAVGGDAVRVVTLVRGRQDPHFIEPRPSFVRELHRADAFVMMGLDLEIGWAPPLIRSARNADIQVGSPGFIDASTVIAPLQVPLMPTDRTMGDVHPVGNPHYLTDPLNGLRVARLLRDRFSELQPESAATFRAGYAEFARVLVAALVGEALVAGQDPDALAAKVRRGQLLPELERRGQAAQLGGWLGALREHVGTKAIQDHQGWPYFALRFGLVLVGTLEPRPGIAPTTRHLSRVVELMRRDGVDLVLASAYFDPRHARWVAAQADAQVLEMANQVDSREGTADYVAMVDHNVRQLLGAF